MSQDRRIHAVPQLEVIHASDDTVRAELIALPVVRRPTPMPLGSRPVAVVALGESPDAPLSAA